MSDSEEDFSASSGEEEGTITDDSGDDEEGVGADGSGSAAAVSAENDWTMPPPVRAVLQESCAALDQDLEALNEKFGHLTRQRWERERLRKAWEHRVKMKKQRKAELKAQRRMKKEQQKTEELRLLEKVIGKARAERKRSSKSQKISDRSRHQGGENWEGEGADAAIEELQSGAQKELLSRLWRMEKSLARLNDMEKALVRIEGESIAADYYGDRREQVRREYHLLSKYFEMWTAKAASKIFPAKPQSETKRSNGDAALSSNQQQIIENNVHDE